MEIWTRLELNNSKFNIHHNSQSLKYAITCPFTQQFLKFIWNNKFCQRIPHHSFVLLTMHKSKHRISADEDLNRWWLKLEDLLQPHLRLAAAICQWLECKWTEYKWTFIKKVFEAISCSINDLTSTYPLQHSRWPFSFYSFMLIINGVFTHRWETINNISHSTSHS